MGAGSSGRELLLMASPTVPWEIAMIDVLST
jgi:hypothetical protein